MISARVAGVPMPLASLSIIGRGSESSHRPGGDGAPMLLTHSQGA